MKTAALGDIATIDRRTVDPTALPPDTPYIGLEHIERGGRIVGGDTVAGAGLASTKFLFTQEHVLFGKLRPNLGKVARPTHDGVCSTDILPVRPGPDLDRSYLAHFLSQPTMIDLAASRATGANLPRLSPASLAAFQIPLPSFDEQRRIAAILDHADALRAKRRQVLAHLDALPKAIFHKMFAGGPWERVPLQEVSDGPGQYGASVSSTSHRPELPRYVRITDIDDSGRLNADVRSPAGPPEGWERHGLHDGDFLFARSGATVGKVYRYRDEDGPCVYAGYLIRFRLRSDLIKPDFLMGFTRTEEYANWVAARQNVVAQPNINAKQYGQELLVPVPDPAHQEEYVNQAERVRKQVAKVKRAAIRDDELFASLQSRAFRGEL